MNNPEVHQLCVNLHNKGDRCYQFVLETDYRSLERRNSELTARIAELEREAVEIRAKLNREVSGHDAMTDACSRLEMREMELERALAEARKDSAWQPIETAPKDGTEILVCGLEYGEGPDRFQRVVYWVETENGDAWYLAEWGEDNRMKVGYLTHWMPLPATPLPETEGTI